MMEPAREVGGDLYDFYDLDDGRCASSSAMSPASVASALFMARTKNVIRLVSRLLRGGDGSAPTPADIVTAVNRELCQDNAGMMFVTLFFGMLDPQTGDLRFTNAGHNPPYHLNGNGPTAVTTSKGRPLGVRDNSAYETGRLMLAPGEEIYLYTDGVTEAANRTDEFFAEERLEGLARRPGHPANVIAVAWSVLCRRRAAIDDITALAIRRVGDHRGERSMSYLAIGNVARNPGCAAAWCDRQ